MAPILNKLLFLSCFLVFVLSFESEVRISKNRWHLEIEQSVTKNIKGKCTWTFSNEIKMPRHFSDNILINVKYPFDTPGILKSFQNLPNSLTKFNIQAPYYASLNGFNVTRKRERWMLPSDHPGQNLSHCYKLLQIASRTAYLDAYQSYRSVRKPHYTARNKHGLVFPSGVVGFECGHFQAVDGCETRRSRVSCCGETGCATDLFGRLTNGWQLRTRC